MSTKKKPTEYEIPEEKPTIVEEPFMPLPTLNLDMSKRYTYADYLTWIDDQRRELIDGFIYLMSAPKRIHAQITRELNVFIGSFIKKNKGKCQVYHAPFDVRIPIEGSKEDDKIYNIVQPDICVICDLSKLDDRGCIGAPDLIVEVLSPSTAQKDWSKKFNLYEEAGVREYWIIDPKAKTVHVFLLQPDNMYDLGTIYECNEKAPVHIFEGLEIDLKELFEE
ncbi:MAG: Uma2 family endonuclease [Lentimicrobiaceae bacterium]|nr:Uma2 family endonuclease [Lentimicrobiaceae bacterium]